MQQNPHVLLTFDKVHNPRETRSERPKVVRTCSVFIILTSKRASRHNGVRFFDISSSKSGPSMVCFVHFDLEMCFAPKRRAFFRHLNFQTLRCFVHVDFQMCFAPQRCALFDISTSKSAPNLLCFVHFDLEMCFAPQRRAVYHFSSGQLLRTRRFSEPTFRSSGASNHWKNTVFRDPPTCSRTWIFFLWRLSLFDFLSSSLLFSDSSHLCFSICPYCRKFDF